MTKGDLIRQTLAFKATATVLAESLHKLNDAIKAIEAEAEKNEGEITEAEAKRHTVLTELYEDTYTDLIEILNKFP